MPSVWLDRDEAATGDLPNVCMRCGDDATTTRKQTFSWYPPWVNILILAGLLPWALVAMILTKKMRVEAPLCDRHAGHWFRFKLFAWVGLLGMVAVFFAGVVMAANDGPRASDLSAGVMIAGGVGFFVVLIAAAVWQMTLIRAAEVTDDDICLKGVSQEFREALREQRRAERDRDDDRPRRRKRSADE